ncbi:possible transcriptional regulator [Mycobacterium leprae]|uniref:Possible transcriptional regulator n=3 Tax=Mycobacterium leprae TaxID=1769 RepID=Q9CBP3_MYCLE|nr:LuxR family transcriptional regulator [Mycobacterium leprae]OAR19579.1 transcriptional regulator [Mycobacterium leprae 3125609]OAX70493.1 transcriptional regulator [Mycobacterium leprae 7935681]CAC30706.1 possible transcriptional regulator [Mycobacterium leprae]CAR71848.1 possible transcriptional regulator [Mycobacterium leprae Br4923]
MYSLGEMQKPVPVGADYLASCLVARLRSTDVPTDLHRGCTVTLFLGDVEGLAELSETQPDEAADAIARLDCVVSEAVAAHGGVQQVVQGVRGNFLATFARASDATACALDLQLAPIVPVRFRIALHTGEVQISNDDVNNVVFMMVQAAGLLDLACGGQTVLSSITGDLVVDGLPADTWLVDLGSHLLRDLARPVRVMQLCHRNLRRNLHELGIRTVPGGPSLPVPLTTFVGRAAQIKELQELLTEKRLLTLVGPGGVGKTRLALQVVARVADEFSGELSYFDLAPDTDHDIFPITVLDNLRRCIGDRRMLMVLDNCEYLLDVCANVMTTLLGACPSLTILATSREPIGVAGEVIWRVSMLSPADEAVELFTERAALVQPGFSVTDGNRQIVTEICQRLDGMPLAIELAAARIRTLSLTEIADGLDDRFRLLTGGARTAVRRQQTLRASMDWSYALLTESERALFRRLSAISGTFDLKVAYAVGHDDLEEPDQVFDRLTMLIDKSLVIVEGRQGGSRYRLLETVRQYAMKKLEESNEVDLVLARHRDHYMALGALLDTPGDIDHEQLVEQVETELDNLRSAFAWSRETGDIAGALQLASSLQPIWFGRGHMYEGLAWFDSIFEHKNIEHLVAPKEVLARAVANKVMLHAILASSPPDGSDLVTQAQQALTMAREIGDSAVLARALTACGFSSGYDTEVARPYFAEAVELARTQGDKWTLSQIRLWGVVGFCVSGDPVALRAAAEAADDLAQEIGDRFVSLQCRLLLSIAQLWQGDMDGAIVRSGEVVAGAEAAHDTVTRTFGLYVQTRALVHRDVSAALVTAGLVVEAAAELSGVYQGIGYAAMVFAALAMGDVAAAVEASEACRPHLGADHGLVAIHLELMAAVALARGDVIVARRLADNSVSATTGWHQMAALTTRARIAMAQGEPELARADIHAALACGADIQASLGISDSMELLAELISQGDNHRQAGRLFGAASAQREKTGEVRFKVWDAGYESAVAVLRGAMGCKDFDSAWAEGAAMPIDDAITYAQRGRGNRKRPTTGWESLTPAEHNVIRLVSEGLDTKDIAARLFVSVRTVHTHLTRIYSKLGLTSRVQLVQEAARHN